MVALCTVWTPNLNAYYCQAILCSMPKKIPILKYFVRGRKKGNAKACKSTNLLHAHDNAHRITEQKPCTIEEPSGIR